MVQTGCTNIAAVDCPGEDTLLRYAGGDLAAPELEQLELHLDACRICREAASFAVRSSPADRTLPAPQPPALLERGASVGRYTVLGLLGAGGMGVVYRAYDPQIDRTVALKLIRPERSASGAASQRLLREAQAMGRLQHPDVIAVHDAGVVGDQVYLAMEYVE